MFVYINIYLYVNMEIKITICFTVICLLLIVLQVARDRKEYYEYFRTKNWYKSLFIYCIDDYCICVSIV